MIFVSQKLPGSLVLSVEGREWTSRRYHTHPALVVSNVETK
jgi:hypothetical protein